MMKYRTYVTTKAPQKCPSRKDPVGSVINWSPGSGFVIHDTDPRIRIRKKYLLIHNSVHIRCIFNRLCSVP